MKKEDIAEILEDGNRFRENKNNTAFEIFLSGAEFDVVVTVPFEVHEIYSVQRSI